MPHTRVFLVDGGGSSVSDAGTETQTESDNEDWVIKKIQVQETGGNDLTDATATISVGGDSVTDQNVQIPTLQESIDRVPEWNLDWPSNTQFEFDWTNNDGGSRTIDVMLWVEPGSGGM